MKDNFYNKEYKEKKYAFCCISFNLDNVDNFLNNNNNNSPINGNNKIIKVFINNLDNCFNYYLMKECKGYNLNCEKCSSNSKYEILSIYSLPNILTLVLSNFENYNFDIQDKIDLKNYCLHSLEDSTYLLVSILCKFSYNDKFILYSFNYKKNCWYSYTNGKISLVKKMDINAIPFVLVYQIKNKKEVYNNLIVEDKICLNIHFTNGSFKKLFFPKESLIKDVKRLISEYLNLEEDKFYILINACIPNENEKLKDITKNNNNIIINF